MTTAAAKNLFLGLVAGLCLVAAALGYLLYQKTIAYNALSREHAETVASTTARIDTLEQNLSDTQNLLGTATTNNAKLAENLRTEQSRNEEFSNQISDISSTVGVLEKLSQTDKELLQKYSKVYFLNENYVPSSLTDIDKEWLYSEDKPEEIHTKVYPFLVKMLKAAKSDDINIWVVSAYRSFSTQASLKSAYTVTYGSGANTFSADQGYSEHQLGTTLDFTTNDLGGGLDGFQNTPAYQWLEDNAYKYGFVLSYPKDNGYYVFEPWHWRFVGIDLAKYLHKNDLNFYDVDQRKIDEYLVSIFD